MKIKTLVIGLATLVLYSPMSAAEVTQVSQIGFVVTNKVSVPVNAEQAYSIFISDVDKWWPKDHSWWGQEGTFSIDAQAGGCFCEIAGSRSAEHMHIVFVDPQKTLTMTGALGPPQGLGLTGALTFQFTAKDNHTTVSMTNSVHGIFDGDFEQLANIVDQVQSMQINGFKQRVLNQNPTN